MTLRNDMSKHRVFVQRLVGTEADHIKSYLEELKRVSKTRVEIGVLGDTLKQDLRRIMKDLPKTATENLTDVAEYESKFSSRMFGKVLGEKVEPVGRESLKKALLTENMSINNVKIKQGETLVTDSAVKKSLITAYKQYGQRKADEVVQIIKDGYTKGLPKEELLNSIDDLIDGRHSTQARSLANTAINYSTNIAKSQVIYENRDIINQEQWIRDTEADSCSECESMDGEIKEAGEFPSPPIHWGCRCEVIPYIEDNTGVETPNA